MPNNQDPGMLEDSCLELANPQSRASAEKCVDDAKEKRAATFQEAYRSKAVVRTYLMWQDESGSPLGQFITRQAPQPNKEIAVSFTDWLQTFCFLLTGDPRHSQKIKEYLCQKEPTIILTIRATRKF